MTVEELRRLLENVPNNLLVGAPDEDGVISEIQSAGVTSDCRHGDKFFYIHPNGDYPLFEEN